MQSKKKDKHGGAFRGRALRGGGSDDQFAPTPGRAQHPAWTIAAFFVKVAIIYGVLVAPPLRVDEAYAWAFRTAANVFFRNVGDGGQVYFSPNPNEKMVQDTSVSIRNVRLQGSPGASFEMNSYQMGYLATAFLIALVLATPVPWPRRLIGLAAGLVLIGAFVGLRIYLQLVSVLGEPSPIAAYAPSPFRQKAVTILIKIFSLTPVTTYIAPIFVWILVAFRREDVARLGSRFEARSRRPTPPAAAASGKALR